MKLSAKAIEWARGNAPAGLNYLAKRARSQKRTRDLVRRLGKSPRREFLRSLR